MTSFKFSNVQESGILQLSRFYDEASQSGRNEGQVVSHEQVWLHGWSQTTREQVYETGPRGSIHRRVEQIL